MLTFKAGPSLTLYAAPAPGSAAAVPMVESPARTYTAADADPIWNIFMQAGDVPAADDVALTTYGPEWQRVTDQNEVAADAWKILAGTKVLGQEGKLRLLSRTAARPLLRL